MPPKTKKVKPNKLIPKKPSKYCEHGKMSSICIQCTIQKISIQQAANYRCGMCGSARCNC